MRRDPAKAIIVLDAMLEFFDGGRRWTRGALLGYRQRRCLIGALRHVRQEQHIYAAGTQFYLRTALRAALPSVFGPTGDPLMDFAIARWGDELGGERDLMSYNDDAANYAEVRDLIVAARALAQAEQARPLHLVPGGPTRGSRRSELSEVTDRAKTPANIDSLLA